MAERKRAAVVDLTDDSPPRPAPARRGHVGLSAAAPIDLDSDQEDSGAASAFRSLPATAQVAPSTSGASASTSTSASSSPSASSIPTSASISTSGGDTSGGELEREIARDAARDREMAGLRALLDQVRA